MAPVSARAWDRRRGRYSRFRVLGYSDNMGEERVDLGCMTCGNEEVAAWWSGIPIPDMLRAMDDHLDTCRGKS
jgi:hypothetical protein